MEAVSLSVNLDIPTSWDMLTDRQLRFAYSLIAAGKTAPQVKMHCLLQWSGLHFIGHLANDTPLFQARASQTNRKRQSTIFTINKGQLATLLTLLDWLDDLPAHPLRLATLRSRRGWHRAADAQLRGLPFEAFLYCDNLYQGYLHTHDTALLTEMGRVLYDAPHLRLNPAENISIFYWFASVKRLFAQTFAHFLQPVSHTPDDTPSDPGRRLTEAMNAQLRALTKGDITKEQAVRNLDTWRALYELDALAREAEEIRNLR